MKATCLKSLGLLPGTSEGKAHRPRGPEDRGHEGPLATRTPEDGSAPTGSSTPAEVGTGTWVPQDLGGPGPVGTQQKGQLGAPAAQACRHGTSKDAGLSELEEGGRATHLRRRQGPSPVLSSLPLTRSEQLDDSGEGQRQMPPSPAVTPGPHLQPRSGSYKAPCGEAQSTVPGGLLVCVGHQALLSCT